MKRIINILLQITLIFALAACSAVSSESADTGSASTAPVENTGEIATTATLPLTVSYSSEDLNAEIQSAITSYIKLEGDVITVEGTGAAVNGSIVTITSP